MNATLLPRRRDLLGLAVGGWAVTTAVADASGGALASYYERHMALVGDTAWGWIGRGAPRPLLRGVVQVGVGKDAWFALRADGTLITWDDDPAAARTLRDGVARFAAGDSGWFAIDRAGVLWQGRGSAATVRVAEGVLDACIGDSADYFITRDGALHAKGLAHRGQYGDGLLKASDTFVVTARDAVAVRAHTGHAIHLARDGTVFGTGGNRYGPLSRHGLGDKADRWGPIFRAATAIATGSRHSLALRADASLWAWGEGFAIDPAPIMERVAAVAAGDSGP
jgi:alpha-tubulin suppressor-like RCC1 family protein